MSIPISGSSARTPDVALYGQSTAGTAAAGAAKESSGAEGGNSRTQATAQLNSSIVQSSLQLSAGNEPLALVLKSAITGINERLAPEFGENAIQNAASQDNSPEGTAGRIVSLSTAFFQAFKEKNPELSDDAAAQKFLDTIKGGIEQGFKEAKEILQGLNVLQGDIASNIDKTYELVQQGLAKFASDHGLGGDGADGATKGDETAGNTGVTGGVTRAQVTITETRSTTISYSASTTNNSRQPS